MALRDTINSDLKEAMKSKEATRVTLIRGVMAAFKDAEQRKREDMVKLALKKHAVTRPTGTDPDTMAAYDKAVTAALAAEKVEESIPLSEAEVLSVVQKLIKQRQDSIAEADKAGRKDIAQAEQFELKLLEHYLPQQLSRQEVEAEAKAIIAQVGAKSAADMGKVMGPLMSKLQGRADGKLISDVVRGLLAS